MLASSEPAETTSDRDDEDAFTQWVRADVASLVGLTRRLIDPGNTDDASRRCAEGIVESAFARYRWSLPTEDSDHDLTRVICRCADQAFAHLGSDDRVSIRSGDAEIDGPAFHRTLRRARRWDRRVATVTLAGGFTAAETALLFEKSLVDVVERLDRVRRRLGDLTGAAAAVVVEDGR